MGAVNRFVRKNLTLPECCATAAGASLPQFCAPSRFVMQNFTATFTDFEEEIGNFRSDRAKNRSKWTENGFVLGSFLTVFEQYLLI